MSKSISSTHSLGIRIGNATQEMNESSQPYEKSFVLDSHTKEKKQSHAKAKTHECGFCKKVFMNTYYLQKHMRIHTGGTENLCLVCEKTFACSSSLMTHNRI